MKLAHLFFVILMEDGIKYFCIGGPCQMLCCCRKGFWLVESVEGMLCVLCLGLKPCCVDESRIFCSHLLWILLSPSLDNDDRSSIRQ